MTYLSGRRQVLNVVRQLPHKRVGGPTQMVNEGVLLRVSVLVHESLDAVADSSSVVLHSELFLPFATGAFHERLVLAKLALDVC